MSAAPTALSAHLDGPLSSEQLFGALFDPVVWADPHPLYADLRATDPLARLEPHLWVASSHDAVQTFLRHPGCSSDERRATLAAEAEDDGYNEVIGDFMLFMDPPDHTRLRQLVVRAFTPRQVRAIEPRAREIAKSLAASAEGGAAFDVVGDFASPMSIQIICELLGVPFADRSSFTEWGNTLARFIDPAVLRTPEQDEAGARAADLFRDYFTDLIATRRDSPQEDLLSELIAAEEDGDRLTHDELISVAMLVFVAGYETTVNLVGNAVVALARHPEQEARLRGDADLLPLAVDEFLRFDSPVQMNIRVALEDIDLDGRRIEAGDTIINFLGAANHDPAVFPEPEALDVGREANPHVAFGGGIHHCLGAALARTEAAVALEVILDTWPSLALAADPVRRPTFTLRGFDEVLLEPSSVR